MAFSRAFGDMDNIGVLMAITNISDDDKRGGWNKDWGRTEKLAFLRQKLAMIALRNSVGWNLEEMGPTAIADHLKGLALTMGVTLPDSWLEIAKGYEPFADAPSEEEKVEVIKENEEELAEEEA